MSVPRITTTADDCPETLGSIEAYLDEEDPGRVRDSLAFAFAARLPDRRYWIWTYRDEHEHHAFLVVTRIDANGHVILSCGASEDPLPEAVTFARHLHEQDF